MEIHRAFHLLIFGKQIEGIRIILKITLRKTLRLCVKNLHRDSRSFFNLDCVEWRYTERFNY
jgi:hypothetical protein